MKKIFLVSLGCPKNLVDSENVLALLGESGYAITVEPEDADIIIVNTCGFVADAVKESESTVQELALKKRRNQKLLVYGCLVQRYGKKLLERVDSIDGLVGTGDPSRVVLAVRGMESGNSGVQCNIRRGCYAASLGAPRLVSTYPYAYLKISEGCDNRCSYCLIPQLRGRLRSRKVADIEEEARSLASMGIRELVLVAQDTTSYGMDMKKNGCLEHLLSRLVRLDFYRVRLMYSHPAHISDRLLELIAGERKICRYLDIPLQHVHPEIVERMQRPSMDYGALIDRIREKIPGVRLRTTLMAGFPGESEKHFDFLLQFIKEKQFDKLGVFRYSAEKGTAACVMGPVVDEEVKEERVAILMEAQRDISAARLLQWRGREIEVLVEGQEGQYCTGRTEFDAPDVDGTVYINAGKLAPGTVCRVKVMDTDEYDMYALLPGAHQRKNSVSHKGMVKRENS